MISDSFLSPIISSYTHILIVSSKHAYFFALLPMMMDNAEALGVTANPRRSNQLPLPIIATRSFTLNSDFNKAFERSSSTYSVIFFFCNGRMERCHGRIGKKRGYFGETYRRLKSVGLGRPRFRPDVSGIDLPEEGCNHQTNSGKCQTRSIRRRYLKSRSELEKGGCLAWGLRIDRMAACLKQSM